MIPKTAKKLEFIPFQGGLDIVSPATSIPPGFVRRAMNMEENILGGYATIKGYERFDGRPSPSNAVYHLLPVTDKGSVSVGDTIVGASSGAAAVVIAITDDGFVVTKTTGTWGAENTTTGGASVTGPVIGGSFAGEASAQYTNLAADEYRADIAPVGAGVCSGPVLGVWYYKGIVYAFRNKIAGGVGMFRSSATGWQEVSLGYEVAFSNANTNTVEGDTLTQGGVTAVINRVVVESGTLLSGVNTGRLIISAPAGGNFAAGAATSTSGGALMLSVAQTAITIQNPNGRFEFLNSNFTGNVNDVRMYGVDGLNRPFEFDGTVFVPLNPGSGIHPNHIASHQNHLFVSYLSSILHSAIGDPYNWTTTAGAGEIALSDHVTGMMRQVGSSNVAVMAIYCRNRTYMLYGTDATEWNVIIYSDDVGALPYSIQKMGETFVMDDRGVTTLRAAQEFGNFMQSSISQRVRTWLAAKRHLFSDSHIARDKGQYRLFFVDGSAAYWTINKDRAAMMPMEFPHKVLCSVSMETFGGGEEVFFFGSDNGMVYQMEKGTSFDGDSIEWFIDLVFNYSKMYRGLKKYRRITFDVAGEGYFRFNSTYALNYNDTNTAQPNITHNVGKLDYFFWDNLVWDNFFWDGVSVSSMSMETPGDGENISIQINNNSDYHNRAIFNGVFLEFSPLRMLR